ncbi:hypothetical protein [Ancrocorticia populi]|nr:hypothetical protein [Ancrocorticia populi]
MANNIPRAPRNTDDVLGHLNEQNTDEQIQVLDELLEDLTRELGKAQG